MAKEASAEKSTTKQYKKIALPKLAVDLTGQKFGRLTANYPERITGKPRLYWNCTCDCGKITHVAPDQLKSGRVVSCGCLRNEKNKTRRYKKILPGMQSGKLTTTGKVEKRGKYEYLECKCSCGNTCVVSKHDFLTKKATSCGCARTETVKDRMHLEGQTFGSLLVLGRDPSCNKWICKCLKCGNETRVTSTELKSGHIKTCGCEKYTKIRNAARRKSDQAKDRYLGMEFTTSCGLKARVIAYSGSGRGTICFEDGTVKDNAFISTERSRFLNAHPALTGKTRADKRPPFVGKFKIIPSTHGPAFSENGQVYYLCYDVNHPEQREILTPQQMMERAGIRPWQNFPLLSSAKKKTNTNTNTNTNINTNTNKSQKMPA